MAGLRHDQRTLRPDLWNAGRPIGEKRAPTAIRLLRPDKFPLRETAQGRALEFPCGSPRSFLATIDAVAKHPCNHLIAAKEMDLKTMRLSLGAPFCINAPDVGF
jgi:hypothetical protein